MSTKTILLAIADPQALADISQELGTEWMPTSVRNEPEAAAQLTQHSFNAFLVDFNLGSPDASELLNQALEERPETTRFLLAYEADLALVAAKVTGTHHILPKPIDFESLKSRIEEGVAAENADGQRKGKDEAQARGPSAKIPEVYSSVLKALEAPGVTPQKVGEIIAGDEALTAEVLRLATSGYLGLPRNLTHPAEAVQSLGLEAVKALVMALRFLAEHSHLRPGYLSYDELWQHSTKVARIARDLVLYETKDRALAAEAFAAGLVHDMGKVVLVTNFDDLYGRVNSLARKQPVALADVEKEMFGASHAEIGGCLVGMWNLPGSIVEATALHHEPPAGEQQQLTPLAAVHIANVLEHQLSPKDGFLVQPTIDARFLNELGLLERLPVWRAAFANRDRENEVPEFEAAEAEALEESTLSLSSPLPTRSQLPGSAATSTRTATTGQPRFKLRTQARGFSTRHWVYAGGLVAATIVILLALWLQSPPAFNTTETVRAKTQSEAPQAVSTVQAPASETAPASVPKPAGASAPAAQPEQTPSAEVPVADIPAVSPPAPVSRGSEPATAIAAPATVATIAETNVAAQNPVPSVPVQHQSSTPEYKLNGIIYTVPRPSAIINGAIVHIGDKVNGATVVGIRPNQVSLRIKGQVTTFSVK